MELVKKYRPKQVKELVGEEQIKVAEMLIDGIRNQDEIKRLLILGSSGLGKTSIVEVYMRALIGDIETENIMDHPAVVYYNCEENRGIDKMIPMLESLDTTNLYSSIKVVFLDELHRLSKQAQEAMLGRLERLPDDVYMMANTNVDDNILPTIKSRFKTVYLKVPPKEAFKKLAIHIAKGEDRQLQESEFEMLFGNCESNLRKFVEDIDSLFRGVYTTKEEEKKLKLKLGTLFVYNNPLEKIHEVYTEIDNLGDYGRAVNALVSYAWTILKQPNLDKGVQARAMFIIEVFGVGLSRDAIPKNAFAGLISTYLRVLEE